MVKQNFLFPVLAQGKVKKCPICTCALEYKGNKNGVMKLFCCNCRRKFNAK